MRIEYAHLAGECMVLLENDGVLPFSDKIKKIALYGNGSQTYGERRNRIAEMSM